MAERTVILYTFSKKFAMTGWRLGCAAAPVPVAEQIAKLNTNDESCTTHFVQAAGVEALRDPSGSVPILRRAGAASRRRDRCAGERAGHPLRQAGGDLLPVPERHRGGAAHRVRRASPTSPPPPCTTPASRSAPATTSAVRSRERPSTTSDSRTRASRPRTSPKGSVGSPSGWPRRDGADRRARPDPGERAGGAPRSR